MVTASEIETIKLLSNSYGGEYAAAPASRGAVAGKPGGLSRIFVGAANAKD
jgi:hypothetical protein